MTGFEPGSTLRVALFPSFMYVKAADGTLHGVAIELAQALAQWLGVRAQLVEKAAPPQVVESLKAGETDIAFLGIDPVRGADVDFAGPLMRAEFTLLVGPTVKVGSIAEADRLGVSIAVVRGHAMETALRGKFPSARTVPADTPDAAFDLLMQDMVDVSAGIRPGLMAYAPRLPCSHVLADSYGSNTIALAVLKGQPERLARLVAFTREAKASGLARRAIDHARLQGIEVPD